MLWHEPVRLQPGLWRTDRRRFGRLAVDVRLLRAVARIRRPVVRRWRELVNHALLARELRLRGRLRPASLWRLVLPLRVAKRRHARLRRLVRLDVRPWLSV